MQVSTSPQKPRQGPFKAVGECLPCAACTLTQTRPHCGAYRMQCLQCCARLVQSARPVRALQESMLTAIARYHDAPKRAEVLAEIARQKKGAA